MKLVILGWGTLDDEDTNLRQFLIDCRSRGLKSIVAGSASAEIVSRGIDEKGLRPLITKTFGRLNNGGGDLRTIVSQANAEVKTTLYVSNDPGELRRAKSFGLITVGLPRNGEKPSEVRSSQPHFYARSFHDVRKILENLMADLPEPTK